MDKLMRLVHYNIMLDQALEDREKRVQLAAIRAHIRARQLAKTLTDSGLSKLARDVLDV